jgi:diadenosine tetraphosphate (Ap4A) HIT family hydrolase
MAEEPARQRLWHLATWPTRHAPGWLLALTARALPPPLRRAASAHWTVMGHPFRSYSAHLVVIARRPLRDMNAGPTVEELDDLVALSMTLAQEHGIERPSLVTNVGGFQSVGQLHFHLVPGEEFAPLRMRQLAFGASCLEASPGEIAALAVEALAATRTTTSGAQAARLFLLDVANGPARPIVAVEVGGPRHA